MVVTDTDEVVALQPVIELVKVNVAVPADIPVTTPALVTEAINGLLLIQVPPVVGDKVIVLPTFTEAGAETTGKGLMVATTAVLAEVVQPPEAAST
jgi:hypothetical protein